MQDVQRSGTLALERGPNTTALIVACTVVAVSILLSLFLVRGASDISVVPGVDAAPPIILEVHADGRLALEGERVQASDLVQRLRIIHENAPTRTLIVRGAPEASFPDVRAVLDSANGAGFTTARADTLPRSPSPH